MPGRSRKALFGRSRVAPSGALMPETRSRSSAWLCIWQTRDSVTSFSMTRRTREIGIRLTLGARPRQILATVLAAEWKPIALGLAAGALGGVMTGPVLGSVLFATSGVEPLVIGAAAVFLGVGALIASYLPARRALRTDPVAALRAQ